MITLNQFREAMAIVEGYAFQMNEKKNVKNTTQTGCRVQLSEFGKEMQGKSKRRGTVIDYQPGVYPNDGTVTVKWDKIRTPSMMHISQITAINENE